MAIRSKAQWFMNAAPEPKKLIRVGRKIVETRERIEMYSTARDAGLPLRLDSVSEPDKAHG